MSELSVTVEWSRAEYCRYLRRVRSRIDYVQKISVASSAWLLVLVLIFQSRDEPWHTGFYIGAAVVVAAVALQHLYVVPEREWSRRYLSLHQPTVTRLDENGVHSMVQDPDRETSVPWKFFGAARETSEFFILRARDNPNVGLGFPKRAMPSPTDVAMFREYLRTFIDAN